MEREWQRARLHRLGFHLPYQGPTHVLSSVLSDVLPPWGLQPSRVGIPSRGRNFLSLERRRAAWQDELESKATSKEAAAVTVGYLRRVRPWEPGFPRGACSRLGDGS